MATSGPFEFAKYKRPRFDGPTHMTRDRAALIAIDTQPSQQIGLRLPRIGDRASGNELR